MYAIRSYYAEAVIGQVNRGRTDWQREIRLDPSGSPLVLLVRGSRLPAPEDGERGHVVVFDDVTILNQAQRDAAWAEVARRLAHEVKNPLTPIRLAAERLRMKLMDRLDRITSYNVCYTKLLRLVAKNLRLLAPGIDRPPEARRQFSYNFV